jgi:LysM repeat protein
METKYHIDVTEEEDNLFKDLCTQDTASQTKQNNKLTFTVIAIAHLAIVAVIGSSTLWANPSTSLNAEDKQLIETSEPKVTPIQAPIAAPIVETTPTPASQPNSTLNKQTKTLTSQYVVKKGDTIYSIAKKYKLNLEQLIQINQIKDPNKITVGQNLKFL